MSSSHSSEKHGSGYIITLSLAALGVVYGDIGTSPLYALRECFHGHYGIAPSPENVLGVLSLIVWALIIVVSIKYLIFIVRADNRGEGGILALMALASPATEPKPRSRKWLLALTGIFGAALLYGDGMITPAISVLSAVEGLKVATPLFEPYVKPITIVILIGLFAVQSRGTASVGAVFGPVTMIWFLTLALLGVMHIMEHPTVFAAINPMYGARFFMANGWHGFLILGSVFLVVTGGEALYADMGHFGVRPIRLAWFTIVLPALMLNYFGQGALLIADPSAAENPFFRMAPTWALYPLVVLSTMATVIASQALISGAFSLTRQAVQLGYMPRVKIEHTSSREIGQIYIPAVNRALMFACIGLVLGFGSSSALAAAYGISVTGTMMITTMLFYVVTRERWKWSRPAALALAAVFLAVDIAFFGANVVKIVQGGWFPLVVAAAIFTLMTTWKSGRRVLAKRLKESTLPIESFLSDSRVASLARVPGTAIFMFGSKGTPPALLHNIKHNKVLHRQNVLLTVQTEEVPHVTEEERITVSDIGHDFWRIVLRYGFMEDPDIPAALRKVQTAGLSLKHMETTYFLGREVLIATKKPGMAIWRERLFAWMSQNSRSATSFFQLPPNRVVELGTQVEI
ncbi:MAG TPA: potassium transporter Kup [Candidatus Kapabacteria bacterium]|nr:potassium transporter Kup [Candidatus Kapabacteria bacterium]